MQLLDSQFLSTANIYRNDSRNHCLNKNDLYKALEHTDDWWSSNTTSQSCVIRSQWRKNAQLDHMNIWVKIRLEMADLSYFKMSFVKQSATLHVEICSQVEIQLLNTGNIL